MGAFLRGTVGSHRSLYLPAHGFDTEPTKPLLTDPLGSFASRPFGITFIHSIVEGRMNDHILKRELLTALLAVLILLNHGSIAQTPASHLSYKVLEQRSIANGGFSRVIVVTKVNPSEADLRALGERLKQDTKSDRNAFIWVYDDERAARNHRAAASAKLTKKELQYHDRHYFALYSRV